MQFDVERISYELIAALRPLLPRIQRRDRALALQLTRAASSISLNVSEANYSDPGNAEREFDLQTTVADQRFDGRTFENEAAFWQLFATRPGMFLGGLSGADLQHYLTGMDRGGDWLGLPKLARLRALVDDIQRLSLKAYGSPFGAYRAYAGDVRHLLRLVGVLDEVT